MRRITVIGAALAAVLVAAAAALAASTLNTYTAKLSFSPHAIGTKAKPVAVSRTELFTAKGTGGHNAAPLTDIKTTVYGLVANSKALPTCSAAKIIAAHNDTVCPPKALVASGYVNAELGSRSLTGATTPCNPLLHVWNAGKNTVEYFFLENGTHQCAGLQTGSTNPYPGYIKQSGANLVIDTPLPPDVSTSAGNLPVYGSLVKEDLVWKKVSGKVGGKTLPFEGSVACKGGKRPYSVKFTATNGSVTQSQTIKGFDKC